MYIFLDRHEVLVLSLLSVYMCSLHHSSGCFACCWTENISSMLYYYSNIVMNDATDVYINALYPVPPYLSVSEPPWCVFAPSLLLLWAHSETPSVYTGVVIVTARGHLLFEVNN